MLTKDSSGQDVNTELVYGIEARLMLERGYTYWFSHRKYKTISSMLTALNHLRTNSYSQSWQYRPIHVYYDLEKRVVKYETKKHDNWFTKIKKLLWIK